MNSLLYRKQQFKYLAALLKVDRRTLEFAINNAESLYREWDEVKLDKRTKEPKLKNGVPATRRLIEAKEPLKSIQAKICRYILSEIALPNCVHGSVKNRSNITNAKAHQGNKYIFTTDLCSFYDTLKSEKVYYFFRRHGYSDHLAHWLTDLTTRNNSIPQGASSSSYIQNLLFKPTDNMLLKFCVPLNITYTRYVDDLTFSCPTCFKEFIPEILKMICHSGCQINNRKTAYSNKILITGIKVNNNYIDIADYLKEHAFYEKKVLEKEGPFYRYWKNVRATNKNCI